MSTEKVTAASPRFWHGMRFLTYCKLLAQGRFRLHFLGIGMFLAIIVYSILNSLLAFLQWIIFGFRISRTRIEQPPIFIIGHWRTGTTFLHELLNQDERLRAPTTFECFAVNHVLISEFWLKPIVRATMPRSRPMDNMPSGPDYAQEDEFAICTLGAPSPYRSMAFPNLPRPHQNLIDMQDVSEPEVRSLKKTLLYFCKLLTAKHGKRLLLKSPTHTGRIELLRELFPGAKFIHVTRDPSRVIPSTVRLWQRLDRVNGFQIPNYTEESLREYVFQTFEKMYRAYQRQTENKSDDICTIKYEDLIDDPESTLSHVYQELEIDRFEESWPRLQKFLEARRSHKTNQYSLSESERQMIDQCCEEYKRQFGYDSSAKSSEHAPEEKAAG